MADVTTPWDGVPQHPDQSGWHILAEWDEEADCPLREFVLWWDADYSLWFDHKAAYPDYLVDGEPPERAVEYHRYVRALA